RVRIVEKRIGRAAFLAPATRTDPERGMPPWIRILSMLSSLLFTARPAATIRSPRVGDGRRVGDPARGPGRHDPIMSGEILPDTGQPVSEAFEKGRRRARLARAQLEDHDSPGAQKLRPLAQDPPDHPQAIAVP